MNEEQIKELENNIDPLTLKAFEEALLKVEAEQKRVKSKAEILMNYINSTNRQNLLVEHNSMIFTPPNGIDKNEIIELLEKKSDFNELENLVALKTEEKLFYYNSLIFTERFATVQSLIQSKNILKTIATITRKDCKSYPRPTRVKTFTDFPYYYTEDEVLGAIARMTMDENYQDIGTVKASNGNVCVYSSLHMSERYAQALCEEIEVEREFNQ